MDVARDQRVRDAEERVRVIHEQIILVLMPFTLDNELGIEIAPEAFAKIGELRPPHPEAVRARPQREAVIDGSDGQQHAACERAMVGKVEPERDVD